MNSKIISKFAVYPTPSNTVAHLVDQHEFASVVGAFAAARPVRAITQLCGPAPAVPNSKSPAGSYSDTFASRSFPHSVRMFALRLACEIFRKSAGAFWPKHNFIRMRRNHTRETSHFITLAC
jgi:hypothetical protein